MQITDKDLQLFRERAKTELQSNGAVGRLAWDAVVNALCNEVEELRKNAAPGNAAALREALANVERVAKYCAETPRHTPGYPTDAARSDVLYSRIAELGRVARAALAAPARNCDRFATEDEAREAYWAYREPLEFNGRPFVAITEWLFDKAEGGRAK